MMLFLRFHIIVLLLVVVGASDYAPHSAPCPFSTLRWRSNNPRRSNAPVIGSFEDSGVAPEECAARTKRSPFIAFAAAATYINASVGPGSFYTSNVTCDVADCIPSIIMEDNPQWVVVVCDSAVKGLLVVGDRTGSVKLTLQATSACHLGSAGLTTAPTVSWIAGSVFHFMPGATSLGPVRLTATSAITTSTLYINDANFTATSCDVVATNNAPTVAGFGFAAPRLDRVSVSMDGGVVGCLSMNLTTAGSGAVAAVGIIGAAGGGESLIQAGIVTVSITRAVVFGPGSATATPGPPPARTPRAVINQPYCGVVVYGLGIAYRGDAVSGVDATVTVKSSVIDAGAVTFATAPCVRGVGAVGVAVWVNKTTACTVQVTEATVQISATAFGASPVSLYVGGVGLMALYTAGQHGVSHNTTIIGSNVTVGPASGTGNSVGYVAAGLIQQATVGAAPALRVDAIMQKSTLTTGDLTVLGHVVISTGLNGFGVVAIVHPALRITSTVDESTITAGAIVAGDYGHALLAGTGIITHSSMEASTVIVSVNRSTVRATSVGARDEEPTSTLYAVAGVAVVAFHLVQAASIVVVATNSTVVVDGPLLTPGCFAFHLQALVGIGYAGDANSSLVNVTTERLSVAIRDVQSPSASVRPCAYETNYTGPAVFGIGVAANIIRNAGDPMSKTVVDVRQSTVTVQNVFSVRLTHCVLGVGLTSSQPPRSWEVSVTVTASTVVARAPESTYSFLDFNVFGIGVSTALWSGDCTYSVVVVDSHVSVQMFAAVSSSTNLLGVGAIAQPGVPTPFTAAGVTVFTVRCAVMISDFSHAVDVFGVTVGIGVAIPAGVRAATNVNVQVLGSTVDATNITCVGSATGSAVVGVGVNAWFIPLLSDVFVGISGSNVSIAQTFWSGAVVSAITGVGIAVRRGSAMGLSVLITDGSVVTSFNTTVRGFCHCCVGAVGIAVRGPDFPSPGPLENTNIIVRTNSRIVVSGFAVVPTNVSDDLSLIVGAVGVAMEATRTSNSSSSSITVLQSNVTVDAITCTVLSAVLGVGYAASVATLGGDQQIAISDSVTIAVTNCNATVAAALVGIAGHALGAPWPSVSFANNTTLSVTAPSGALFEATRIQIARILPTEFSLVASLATGAAVVGVGVAGGLVVWDNCSIQLSLFNAAVRVFDVNVSSALASVVGGVGTASWRDDGLFPTPSNRMEETAQETAGSTVISVSASVMTINALRIIGNPEWTGGGGMLIVGAVGVASLWLWTPIIASPISNALQASIGVSFGTTVTAAVQFISSPSSGGSVVAGHVGGVGIVTCARLVTSAAFVRVGNSDVAVTVRWSQAGADGTVRDDLDVSPTAARFTTPGILVLGHVAADLGAGDGFAFANWQRSSVRTALARLWGAVAPTLGRTAGPDVAVFGVVIPDTAGWASGGVSAFSSDLDCGTGPCVQLPAVGGATAPADRAVSVDFRYSNFTACSAAPWSGVLFASQDAAYRPLLINVNATVWNPQHPATVPFSNESHDYVLRRCTTESRTRSPVSLATATETASLSQETGSASSRALASRSLSGSETWLSETGSFSASSRALASRSHATVSRSDTLSAQTASASGDVSGSPSPSRSFSPSVDGSLTRAATSPSLTATASMAVPRPVIIPPRSGVVVVGTGLGVVAQFAVSGLGSPLAALRTTGLSASLRRLGTAQGCRGQDPTATPEWLTSPLQLGMADGRDFVTGTAVGAPICIVVATCAGAVLGAAVYILRRELSARARHWRLYSSLPPKVTKLGKKDSPHTALGLAAAAGGGAAQFLIAASAIVSQPAAAAAVLRAAEGSVAGTPSWYPAVAVICALLSFVPVMILVWVAWPAPVRAIAHHRSLETDVVYMTSHDPLRVVAAAALRRRGLRGIGHEYTRDGGRWVAPSTTSSAVGGATSAPARDDDRLAATPSLLLPGFHDGLLLPVFVPPAAPVAQALPSSGGPVNAPLLAAAAGAAWREALHGEYCGHARFVAQFVVASQALQGLAQAAGEFAPRGVDGGADRGASASCVAATSAQLVLMVFSTVLLLWAQPHRARRNFDAEMLPTTLQAGICAPVALLAARRYAVNPTIAAGLDNALGASGLLQPILGIGLAVYGTISEIDFDALAAGLSNTPRPRVTELDSIKQ